MATPNSTHCVVTQVYYDDNTCVTLQDGMGETFNYVGADDLGCRVEDEGGSAYLDYNSGDNTLTQSGYSTEDCSGDEVTSLIGDGSTCNTMEFAYSDGQGGEVEVELFIKITLECGTYDQFGNAAVKNMLSTVTIAALAAAYWA